MSQKAQAHFIAATITACMMTLAVVSAVTNNPAVFFAPILTCGIYLMAHAIASDILKKRSHQKP